MSSLVLVTGGAGEMGSRLVKRLLEDGRRVRALIMTGDPLRARLAGLDCQIVEGDLRDPASLRAATAGVDTVIHAAAVILATSPAVLDSINRQGTANVLAAAQAARVRHFIYVSSASVTYPRLTPYGRSKLAAEQLVRDAPGLAHTIVRPTLVYDRGGGQEFMLFVGLLRRFPVVPFIGDGSARKSPVRAEDVVDGLARIVGSDVAFGQTYNLSGGESITIEELGRRILELQGDRKPFIHLPVWLCRTVGLVLGWVMKTPPLTQYGVSGFVNHADLDCAQATRDLGYKPVGARVGLLACFGNRATLSGAFEVPEVPEVPLPVPRSST